MKTYKEQFDKLTEAYIKLQVNPFTPCNCFVGNLLDGNSDWEGKRDYHMMLNKRHSPKSCVIINEEMYKAEGYTIVEIIRMERAFLRKYVKRFGTEEFVHSEKEYNGYELYNVVQSKHRTWKEFSENQEEALFLAFEAALDVLKNIHIEHGEVVDEIEFKKRELKHEGVL